MPIAAFDQSRHPRGHATPDKRGAVNPGEFGQGSGGKPAPRGKGKPGKGRTAGALGKAGGLNALRKLGQAVLTGAHQLEHAATAAIVAQVARLPGALRLPVVGAWRLSFASYTAAQAGVRAVARERGYTDAEADRVAHAVGVADVLAGAKGLPMALTAAGLGPLALPASFLPIGSLSYLAYSTARNPLATLRAARKAVAAVAEGGRQALRPQVGGAAFQWPGLPEQYAADPSRDDLTHQLLDRLRRYGQGGLGDHFEAALYAALDKAPDLKRALSLADLALLQSVREYRPWLASGSAEPYAGLAPVLHGDQPPEPSKPPAPTAPAPAQAGGGPAPSAATPAKPPVAPHFAEPLARPSGSAGILAQLRATSGFQMPGHHTAERPNHPAYQDPHRQRVEAKVEALLGHAAEVTRRRKEKEVGVPRDQWAAQGVSHGDDTVRATFSPGEHFENHTQFWSGGRAGPLVSTNARGQVRVAHALRGAALPPHLSGEEADYRLKRVLGYPVPEQLRAKYGKPADWKARDQAHAAPAKSAPRQAMETHLLTTGFEPADLDAMDDRELEANYRSRAPGLYAARRLPD